MKSIVNKNKRMQSIKSKNTKIELKLRKKLRQLRIFFYKNKKIFGVCPDILLPQYKIAIFCDGEFWHGKNINNLIFHKNETFWKEKLKRNIERDLKTDITLRDNGWESLRFWENDINKNIDLCIKQIFETINRRPFKMKPNGTYGFALQNRICEIYNLDINETAKEQFVSSINIDDTSINFSKIVKTIFDSIADEPIELLTYTTKNTPHNFLLKSRRTLSIRTCKTSDKVAPRILGQAGYLILNSYFQDIYQDEIVNQNQIKELMYTKIDKVLPYFINALFMSDITVIINFAEPSNPLIFYANEVGNFQFNRSDFQFTRSLEDWNESITLKFKNISIAEIQVHRNRTFKFRFIVNKIGQWFNKVKLTNETMGMSAEAAICDIFNLEKPESFNARTSITLIEEMKPYIKSAFQNIPKPIKHTGSMQGTRGEQSKCSYDFLLTDDKTLSLKTNTGNMVCPPEVGQPGLKTLKYYFDKYLDTVLIYNSDGSIDYNRSFKLMVYEYIDKLLPIYIDHLFDSDFLLWIRKTDDSYITKIVKKEDVGKFEWNKENFSFTKENIADWNESNTLKYDGISIGEFQVHNNRQCYKFRFNFNNLIKILKLN